MKTSANALGGCVTRIQRTRQSEELDGRRDDRRVLQHPVLDDALRHHGETMSAGTRSPSRSKVNAGT